MWDGSINQGSNEPLDQKIKPIVNPTKKRVMSIHIWSSIVAGSFGKCTEKTPFHFSCVPIALGTVMTMVGVKNK